MHFWDVGVVPFQPMGSVVGALFTWINLPGPWSKYGFGNKSCDHALIDLHDRMLKNFAYNRYLFFTFPKQSKLLTLCSPNSTIGTAAPSPNSTFGTDNGAMQNGLNPIVLHLCTQLHCLEPRVNIHWIPIVGYWGELPALSVLLIVQLRYLAILTNNLAFIGSVHSEQRVNHDFLLSKLFHLGIRGIAWEWFRDYLSDRYQFTSYNNTVSHRERIQCRLSQGSILCPLLFLIYIHFSLCWWY